MARRQEFEDQLVRFNEYSYLGLYLGEVLRDRLVLGFEEKKVSINRIVFSFLLPFKWIWLKRITVKNILDISQDAKRFEFLNDSNVLKFARLHYTPISLVDYRESILSIQNFYNFYHILESRAVLLTHLLKAVFAGSTGKLLLLIEGHNRIVKSVIMVPNHSFNILVVWDWYGYSNCFCTLSNQRKGHSYTLVHGAFGKNSVWEFLPCAAQNIVVWSEYQKNIINKAGIDASRIFISRFLNEGIDKQERKKISIDQVSLVTSAIFSKKWFTSVTDSLPIEDFVKVNLCLHPSLSRQMSDFTFPPYFLKKTISQVLVESSPVIIDSSSAIMLLIKFRVPFLVYLLKDNLAFLDITEELIRLKLIRPVFNCQELQARWKKMDFENVDDTLQCWYRDYYDI